MKRSYVLLSAVFGLLTCAFPALAEEAEHHGSKTLPQLDVALYPGVLFWMIAAFLSLLAIIFFFGLPGIRQTLEKRQRLLDADLEAARAASAEADAVVKAYEADLLEARRTAQETVSGIVAAASREAMAQSDKQESELKHRMIVAHENIAQAKEKALKDTQPFINDLVQQIVTRAMEADFGAHSRKAGS